MVFGAERWLSCGFGDGVCSMGMLDRVANGNGKAKPFFDSEPCFVAEPGERHAGNVLHDEERPTEIGGAGVEHPGDAGMIHERERLPLGFEPRDDVLAVHPRLDDLNRDLPPYGVVLLGKINRPHAAFADLLDKAVIANGRADACVGRKDAADAFRPDRRSV